MKIDFERFFISDDHSLLDFDRIFGFLERSYWANNRARERILLSIENSRCFGVFMHEGTQVGFARVVSDNATVYYLCDVFVDEGSRGHGIGKALVEAIVGDEAYQGMPGMLLTLDAHGLYEKYGFEREAERFMRRAPR